MSELVRDEPVHSLGPQVLSHPDGPSRVGGGRRVRIGEQNHPSAERTSEFEAVNGRPHARLVELHVGQIVEQIQVMHRRSSTVGV